jgi:RpiR family carbohydrate utilization transcriptional regulator
LGDLENCFPKRFVRATKVFKDGARPMNESSFAGGENGDLVERIQERYSSLRKSERVVADYLREHAGERVNYSITDFAQVLGVSEATISRLSRALGYKGYPDLKLSMAANSGPRTNFSNIPQDIDQSDTLISTSSKLANLLAQSILGTQRMLDAQKLEACLDAIRNARRVVLIGVGGAAAICEETAHLFIKAGIDAFAYNDTYTQVIAAANLYADCTMIGISHTGTTQGVANALTLAHENGAKTIAITGDPASTVASAADIVLTTWNSQTPSVPLYGDFLEGRISQLFLVDLLYLGLIFEEEADRADHLKMTARALERYYRSDNS